MDPKGYKEKLEAYLWLLYDAGLLEDWNGEPIRDDEEKAELYISNLKYQVDLEGVNSRLPHYQDIIGHIITPEWQAKRAEEQREYGLAERQVGLAEKKFETGEAWKRWEVERRDWEQGIERREAFRQEGMGLAVRAQERQHEQWQTSEQLKAAQANLMTRRLANLTNQPWQQQEQQPTQSDWMGQAKYFEDMRKRLLGGLDPRRDWIQAWQIKNVPNPAQQAAENWQGRGAGEQIASVKEELTRWEDAKKTGDKMIKEAAADPEKSLSVADMQFIKGIDQRIDTAERQLLYWQTGTEYAEEQQYAHARPTGEPGVSVIGAPGEIPAHMRPVKPTTPPTPEWLTQFTGLKAEQPIEKRHITTPSAQTWGKTPWSTRQGLAGYMGWTGQPMEDMLAEMQRVLPRDPSAGYRWSPARQYA